MTKLPMYEPKRQCPRCGAEFGAPDGSVLPWWYCNLCGYELGTRCLDAAEAEAPLEAPADDGPPAYDVLLVIAERLLDISEALADLAVELVDLAGKVQSPDAGPALDALAEAASADGERCRKHARHG